MAASNIRIHSQSLITAKKMTQRENDIFLNTHDQIDLDKLRQDLIDAVVIGTETSGASPLGEPFIALKRVNSAFRILKAAEMYLNNPSPQAQEE